MRWAWVLVGCLCMAGGVWAEDDDSRGSLVRVRASIQPYDQFRPWQKKSPYGLNGTGVVLPGGKVLATAALVANRTEVGLEKPGSAEKCAAEVEAIDYEANLALLQPVDRNFLKGFSGVLLGPALRAGDKTEVWQLEKMGKCCETKQRFFLQGWGDIRRMRRDFWSTGCESHCPSEMTVTPCR